MDDLDWTSEDEEVLGAAVGSSQLNVIPNGGSLTSIEEASSSAGVTISGKIKEYVVMGFSEKMVMKAIAENGEDNPGLILDALLTYSTLEGSPELQQSVNSDPCSSDYNENAMEDLSDFDLSDIEEDHKEQLSEQHKMLSRASTGSLTEKEKNLLDLANMGYPVEDADIAMQRCGPDASLAVLVDFLCAAQIARQEDCYLRDEIKPNHRDDNKKKRKFNEMSRNKELMEDIIRLPNPMIGFGVPFEQSQHQNRSLPENARGPPYFYYENVALAPKGVWDTISRHLYEIEPEFVDSKYFCAAARKRGYIHNLPIEGREPLLPLPPLTVQQAFPLHKRWWPSWDPRDKLNCIQTAIASAKLTERIRAALERYEVDPPEQVQKYILDQCRKWNLVWVGRNKVAPLEPDEVEMLLGFPKSHTRGGGISRTDRYKSLGNSFQVDTVAYHLSVLRNLYPDGINILSLFSGIGGGEVALHRLGIKLKNVVSIEKSKANRDIVSSWWDQTNQTGNLMHFDDVQQIDYEKLNKLVETFGGFDLVIGGSPCNNLAGSNRVSRDGLEGKESSLFFDYVRILDMVREIMRNNQHNSD